MALIELIDFKKIRKALWYLLCIIISISLQNLLCARVAIFGVHAFFIPVVIIAFGVFEGAVWGASLGLVAGYFCDITMLESTVLFMVGKGLPSFVAMVKARPSMGMGTSFTSMYKSTPRAISTILAASMVSWPKYVGMAKLPTSILAKSTK